MTMLRLPSIEIAPRTPVRTALLGAFVGAVPLVAAIPACIVLIFGPAIVLILQNLGT